MYPDVLGVIRRIPYLGFMKTIHVQSSGSILDECGQFQKKREPMLVIREKELVVLER